MFELAMSQMTFGSGLCWAVLFVCITLLAFRLIEVAVCAVRKTLHWLGDVLAAVYHAAFADDEPSRPQPAVRPRRSRREDD